MDDEYNVEHTCYSCGAVFTIQHDMYDDVLFCPFCGDDALIDEEMME